MNSSDGPPVLQLPDHVNDASAINVHHQKAGIMREQNNTGNCKQNVLKLVFKKIMIHVFKSYTFF